MSVISILTVLLVLGVVWGGLIFLITRAFKYEKGKEKLGEE
jgi:hypothetical protein